MAKYFELALLGGGTRTVLKGSGPKGICKNCGGQPHCGNRSNEGVGGVPRPGYGPKRRGAGRPDCKHCACPKCRPEAWTDAELEMIGYKG